ncbi:MAG: TolC family protein [Muribaculaceae bacterium]|nr:TolC family protein [Muribaculaceae bacterium]
MSRITATLLAAGIALSSVAMQPLDNIVTEVIARDNSLSAELKQLFIPALETSAENTAEGPEVEFEHLWGRDGDTRWSLGVSEEINWPGLYGARRELASRQDSLAYCMSSIIIFDAGLEAKLLVLDAVNARARLDFYIELDNNLRRISTLTEESYNLGEATILDLRKTQLALLDSRGQIQTARAELESSLAGLRAKGVSVPAGDNEIWEAYPMQNSTAPSTEAESYPQYALAQAGDRVSMAASRVIKHSSLPSFSLGYVHAFEEQTHFNGLTISVKLPTFSRKRKMALLNVETEANTLAYSGALQSAMAEVAGQYLVAQSLAGTIADYERLSGDNSYLQLLGEAFDGGELTVIDYLNEVNLFKSARLNYIDLLYRYNMALARLNRYRSTMF